MCPIESALKVKDAGKIRVNWSSIRVEMLRARKCHRYLQFRYAQIAHPMERH